MRIPDWWEAVLLSLAAYRSWRLLAEDDLLDRPRRILLRIGSDWRQQGDPVPVGYRAAWAEFLTCPACFGFWVALAWWGAWLGLDEWATMAAAPLAISTVLIVVRSRLDPPE
jgi:hypothetical protein